MRRPCSVHPRPFRILLIVAESDRPVRYRAPIPHPKRRNVDSRVVKFPRGWTRGGGVTTKRRKAMFHIGGAAVVAATFLLAVSGSAMPAAAADPAGTVLAQAAGSAQERTRQDCIRNGGWYTEGGCEYESKAKAAAMESDKQACQREGGYMNPASGAREV